MNPTAEELKKINDANRALTTTAEPAPVSLATLSSTDKPMNIPPVAPVDDITADINSIPTVESIVASADKTSGASDIEKTQKSISERILASTEKVFGREEAQVREEAEAGVPELNKRLNEINGQIRQLQATALANQEKALESGETLSFAAGEAQRVARNDAIKAMSLSAIAQTIQGDLALALETANRAVDLEFAPIEKELAILSKSYELNRDLLTRADSKRAEALGIALTERSRILSERKEEKSQIYSIAMEAAKMGADTATVNKILGAKTTNQALSSGSSVLGNEFRLRAQSMALDNKYKQAQIDKIYEELKPTNNISLKTADDVVSVLKSSKVGQGTKTQLGTIMGVINAAESLAKARPTGKFKGINPFGRVIELLKPEATKRKETIENEGYFEGINLKIQQWASGAALTEAQTEQVKRMTPDKNDTDRVVKTKINNLTNFMQNQISGALEAEGIEYVPEKIDLWAPVNTLADIFNQ